MCNQIGRVPYFVLSVLTFFSILSSSSCLQQPYHNLNDPFASNPVLQNNNRPEQLPVKNSYQNPSQVVSAAQPNNQQANYQQPNNQQPIYQQQNYQQPNYQRVNYQQPNNQQPNYQQLNNQQSNYQQPNNMLLSAASNSVNYGHPEKTADNVNFSNCYPSNYSNQPNVYSYSNTVVNSNMPSNLQVVPHIQNLSSGNAAENRSSSQTREIRQITHGDDDVQNYYRYNNSSYNYPVTSDSGVLQASLVYSQESGGFGGNSGIKIDPSLNQLGAGVMAEHNSNRKFSGQWRPNTSYGFWPQAEYLADGGDGSGNGRFDNARVQVDNDWTVRNLETGDTVAHYDTIDGRVEVEASNRVHIYAPRFGAVRKVIGVVNTDHISSLGEMNHQVSIGTGNSSSGIGKTSQEFAAGYTRGRDDLRGIQSRVMGAGLESNHGVIRYSNFESVISYSDTLRLKNLSSAEIIHLAEGYKNARAWQGTGGVQVKASYRVPMSMSLDEGAGQLFKVDDSGITGNSKLRLIKTASKSAAKSGDIIEFTLRFDNLGTEPIGNITIIDNLTTRLEFISDSAMASVPAGFFTEPNGSASFTLRFEITDPLEAGQFGVVQFRCRVL